MINSEKLIALVRSNPELWDAGNTNYPNKNLKLKTWVSIAEKLGVTVEAAKSRWTNLRDLFRRELKKTLRMVKETGDPKAHEPRWRYFKAMLYLKDQMAKDDTAICLQYDEPLYPQTILEDEPGVKIEDDSFVEDSNSTPSYQERTVLPSSSNKRPKDSSEDQNHISSKKHHWDDRPSAVMSYGNYEDYSSRPLNEMDEDYHFLMSILPAVRRVRQDRKTSFKMKVLQLIMEEENAQSAERT